MTEKEASRNLGDPPWSSYKWSTPTERTIHRKADAAVEVGPADSTRSVGKPYTWGSGRAERVPGKETYPYTQRWIKYVNTIEQDSN